MALVSSRKYTLTEIHQIGANGFNWTLSPETVENLDRISKSLTGEKLIRNPMFDSKNVSYMNANANTNNSRSNFGKNKNKKMDNSTDNEWKSQPFKSTKIEHKLGIDGNIDKIRLYLNKISEKTYLQMRENIFSELMIIYENELTYEDNHKLCDTIYEFSSSNKFYSNIFADLYAELVTMYQSIREHFNRKTSLETILSIYDDICHADPNQNYDLYCDIIKKNEKRRSTSQFYINLAKNNLLSKETIAKVLYEILKKILRKIEEPNNKEEVDELVENVMILYNRDVLDEINEDAEEYMFDDENMTDIIEKLAGAKSKDYASLSNKSIFKFMDLIDA